MLPAYQPKPYSRKTDGISYQAVIIDNNASEIPGIDVTGNYLSEGQVELKFTIMDEKRCCRVPGDPVHSDR